MNSLGRALFAVLALQVTAWEAKASDAGMPRNAAPLGKACTKDADCGDARLSCLLPSSKDLGGRGPAGGICTVKCTASTDCATWDPRATCIHYGTDLTKQYCFEGCSQNSASGPDFDPSKCHGRADMGCTGPERSLTNPTCLPLCSNDAECGSGLHCHGGSGLCQTDAPTGDGIGSVCDPKSSPTTCAGYCSSFPNGSSFCTEFCSIGAPTSCGFSGTGEQTAACVGNLTSGGETVGDVGDCLRLCNCDADCPGKGFLCRATALALGSGARGTCYPAAYVSQSIATCAPNLVGCVYGSIRACKGTNGCLGAAECLPDGSGYGSCSCVDAGNTETPSDAAVQEPPAGTGGSDSGTTHHPSLTDAGVSTGVEAGTEPVLNGKSPPVGCSCRAVGSGGDARERAGLGALMVAFAAGVRRRSRKKNR